MDEDAAFLRSIGIACEDGAPTLHEREDEWREKVRRAVLDALDSLAPTLGNHPGGWRDADLANLFPALDKHADALFERHEMAWRHYGITDPRTTN